MDDTVARRIGLRRDEPERAPAPPPPPVAYAGLNIYAADPVLSAALDTTLDEEAEDELVALGAYWGSAEAQEVARIAAKNPPALRVSDFEGRPVHQVEVHPAFHALLNRSIGAGLAASAWEEGEERRQHRMRAAAVLIAAQCERSHLLPIGATHASVAALAYASDLEGELFPLIASRVYDRRPLPSAEKEGALIALATREGFPADGRGEILMRAEAASLGSPSDGLAVTGEKAPVWFPTADHLLVLTRTIDGPTAALVPRHPPHGDEGAVRVTELLSTTGLCAAPVAQLSFRGAPARLVGEPGRGLQVLRDVRTLTQLDSALIAAGAMRGALSRAVHHARTHFADGRALIADPLTSRVLADLALESAAQTALTLRIAAAFDQAFDSDGDHAIARIATPSARVLALKCAVSLTQEACEALGTPAALADHPAARIASDLAALTHWDGAASGAAAECVRLISRDANVLGDALEEIASDIGEQNEDLVDDVRALAERALDDGAAARAFAERLALLTAVSAMRRNLPRVVCDAYMETRLRAPHRIAAGALDTRFDAAAILDFIVPED